MRKHKLLSLILAAVLTLGTVCTAAAEMEFSDAVDACLGLLFYTENVTVTGSAEFTLDGQRFKGVDVTYVQAGEDSYWDLKTHTPKADGTEREGGYTIIANGEDIYVMEVYYPGLYKMASDQPQTTLMRQTSLLGPMTTFLKFFAEYNELPMTAASTANGRELRLKLTTDEVPLLMDAGLDVAFQYLAGRYFGTGMDHSELDPSYNKWYRYLTVTQALVNTTVGVRLWNCDVVFALDADDRLTGTSGSLTFRVEDNAGTFRMLDVTYELTADKYGESTVARFNPEDYGVVPPQEYWGWYNGEEDEEIDPETDPIDEAYIERAKQAVADMGHAVAGEVLVIPFRNDGYVKVNVFGGDMDADVMVSLYEDKTVAQAYNLNNPVLLWDAETEPVSGVDKETLTKAVAFLQECAAKMCPVSGKLAATLEATGMARDAEGGLYLYFEDSLHSLFFILKVEPEWTVEGYRLESVG